MAETEVALADPGGPNSRIIGAPFRPGWSPAVTALMCALTAWGRRLKSECVSVLAGKQACLNDMALNAASSRSCSSCSHRALSRRAARQPSLSPCSAKRARGLDRGQRNSFQRKGGGGFASISFDVIAATSCGHRRLAQVGRRPTNRRSCTSTPGRLPRNGAKSASGLTMSAAVSEEEILFELGGQLARSRGSWASAEDQPHAAEPFCRPFSMTTKHVAESLPRKTADRG